VSFVGLGVDVGVFVGVNGIDVTVAVGIIVSVGTGLAIGTHEVRRMTKSIVKIFFIFSTLFCKEQPNGLRYLRVGGRGFCLGAEKTRSQKNA